MDPETFNETLRQLARRTPFKPFTIELHSGSRIEVIHPEGVAFDAGIAVYISPAGKIAFFDHNSVSQLGDLHSAPPKQAT